MSSASTPPPGNDWHPIDTAPKTSLGLTFVEVWNGVEVKLAHRRLGTWYTTAAPNSLIAFVPVRPEPTHWRIAHLQSL